MLHYVCQVHFLTTGNGAVRFNPNLYNCGKVSVVIMIETVVYVLVYTCYVIVIISDYTNFVCMCTCAGLSLAVGHVGWTFVGPQDFHFTTGVYALYTAYA